VIGFRNCKEGMDRMYMNVNVFGRFERVTLQGRRKILFILLNPPDTSFVDFYSSIQNRTKLNYLQQNETNPNRIQMG
jgi:hypothetical protein